MTTKQCKAGEVIFREGTLGNTMYEIKSGTVAIYAAYGTPDEKKLTELEGDAFFGEMGMIDHAPRSATAVALKNHTQLQEITEDQLGELFRDKPAKVLDIMQHLSHRLRKLTGKYMEACKTAAGAVALKEKEVSAEAAEQIHTMIDEFAAAAPVDFT